MRWVGLSLWGTTLIGGLTACGSTSAAEDAVRLLLKDPDSAQFRDVRACPGDADSFTGEVNSKNSFGGYVGFVQFYVIKGQAYLSGQEDSDGLMQAISACAGPGPTEAEKAANRASADPIVREAQAALDDAGDVAAAADAAAAEASKAALDAGSAAKD
jgi:hypothetical protein